jgi:hypothetical protein
VAELASGRRLPSPKDADGDQDEFRRDSRFGRQGKTFASFIVQKKLSGTQGNRRDG